MASRRAEAVVSDTHPLLFHAAGGSRLGRLAARVFAAAERRETLCAAAMSVGLPLLTRDADIQDSGLLTTIW